MCFAAKQPKVDARFYKPPTQEQDVRSNEFEIAQRVAHQAVVQWRKEKHLKKSYERHKAAFKAKMIEVIENMIEFPADFEDQVRLINLYADEMHIRNCVHMAMQDLHSS